MIEYRQATAAEPPPVSRAEANAQVHGPWRFSLRRPHPTLVEGALRTVADGVRFADDTCVLRWKSEHRSTAVYASMASLVAVHVEAHDRTEIRWIDPEPTDAFTRGANECVQDSCENCPFASVGGLGARAALRVPSYIDAASEAEWLRGYLRSAQAMYGDDWRTCSFGWSHALTIGGQ